MARAARSHHHGLDRAGSDRAVPDVQLAVPAAALAGPALTFVPPPGHLTGTSRLDDCSGRNMAKISGSDIRPGMVIEHEGSLWAAVKSMAVKPGKGPAYNQVEMKNLLDGRKLNQRFGGTDRVEETEVERRQFQFLYRQDDQLVFMDTANYDQLELNEEFVGERVAFLQDGMMVQVQMHQSRPIGIKLPESVVLEVVEADAVIKGQTAASSYKPAKLENGLRLLVPPFISAGEKVVVSTDEVSYLRRAE
jgi:elongation factor P